jgi:hypothetical protein
VPLLIHRDSLILSQKYIGMYIHTSGDGDGEGMENLLEK